MDWFLSHRADKNVIPLADRHYNRQKIGSPQFVPPGTCLVLATEKYDSFWVTSWPKAEYVKHAWAGAWVCSAFRNESDLLSSDLIRQAVSATRSKWEIPPSIGMITFVDPKKVRKKRDFGRCYLRAGFRPARCVQHPVKVETCPACNSKTRAGLIALQLLPEDMPDPIAPILRAGDLAFV